MLRKTDHCTEYKNRDLKIRYDPDTIEDSKQDSVLTISSVLDEIDCYFIGETYCLGNFYTGHTVYNAHSDLVYVFPWHYLEYLEAGRPVKLIGRKPDNADREILETEGF